MSASLIKRDTLKYIRIALQLVNFIRLASVLQTYCKRIASVMTPKPTAGDWPITANHPGKTAPKRSRFRCKPLSKCDPVDVFVLGV